MGRSLLRNWRRYCSRPSLLPDRPYPLPYPLSGGLPASGPKREATGLLARVPPPAVPGGGVDIHDSGLVAQGAMLAIPGKAPCPRSLHRVLRTNRPPLSAVVVAGLGPLAVAVPRSGVAYAALGLAALFRFWGMPFGIGIGIFLIVAGILYWFGRPRPRKLALWITAGLPVLAAVATVVMLLIVGPPVQ